MDRRNRFSCRLLELGQRPGVIRVSNVDQVVGDARTFFGRGFGGANVHATVEEARVGADDFSIPALGYLNGDLSFANGSRADD